MLQEYDNYKRFTGPQELDKSLHTLEGIMEGISFDYKIDSKEVAFLNDWLLENIDKACFHPFNEVYPVVQKVVEDGIIDEEEKKDILWLCKKIRTENNYFDTITSDMQRLQAILGGIIADAVITKEELLNLRNWLSNHEHLRKCYPYDELEALIMSVLEDGKIDQNEHKELSNFFTQFSAIADDKILTGQSIDINNVSLPGVCAVCPEISFRGKTFCFTGKSAKMSREELAEKVILAEGIFTNHLSNYVDYLIIGADGNPAWSYACYGRKVEKAINFRKKGANLLIIHEYDFWDAFEDLG